MSSHRDVVDWGVPEFVGSWGVLENLSVHSARPEFTDWCLLVILGVFALVS